MYLYIFIISISFLFVHSLLKDITKKLKPGDIKQYCVKKEMIICAFIKPSEYTTIEEAFKNIKHSLKEYRYLAIQNDLIQSDDSFNHISRIVLILRSIINNSELWLCGYADQKHNSSYDDYCRTRYQDYSSRYYSNLSNRKSYNYNNNASYNSQKEYNQNRVSMKDSQYDANN